jgi:hypothetical protein
VYISFVGLLLPHGLSDDRSALPRLVISAKKSCGAANQAVIVWNNMFSQGECIKN